MRNVIELLSVVKYFNFNRFLYGLTLKVDTLVRMYALVSMLHISTLHVR